MLKLSQKTRVVAVAKTTKHKVKLGETLIGIANRYGVSMDELLKENRLRNKGVRVGQRLKIPD